MSDIWNQWGTFCGDRGFLDHGIRAPLIRSDESIIKCALRLEWTLVGFGVIISLFLAILVLALANSHLSAYGFLEWKQMSFHTYLGTFAPSQLSKMTKPTSCWDVNLINALTIFSNIFYAFCVIYYIWFLCKYVSPCMLLYILGIFPLWYFEKAQWTFCFLLFLNLSLSSAKNFQSVFFLKDPWPK